MIHPQTTVQAVSDIIGSGVFATAFLPKGTIMVVRDQWDLVFSQNQWAELPAPVRNSMETWAYHDKEGNLVLSWDHAKYMNHSCHSNTMMTAAGFEIAVRDIQAGEEITTEYGLLNVQEPYPLFCNCLECRKELRLDDIDRYGSSWDTLIGESVQAGFSLTQPLAIVFTEKIHRALQEVRNGGRLPSVKNLKWRNTTPAGNSSRSMPLP